MSIRKPNGLICVQPNLKRRLRNVSPDRKQYSNMCKKKERLIVVILYLLNVFIVQWTELIDEGDAHHMARSY